MWLQVKDLTKYLDPSGLGVISFEDFHRGIRAIKNGGEFAAVLQGKRETSNLTPQGLTKLRSCLMKANCVWFSTLCWAERKAERLGAFSNRIEKGSRAFVVVVACFPVYQEITFLNACWKWKSH